jgi:hypothetical protein
MTKITEAFCRGVQLSDNFTLWELVRTTRSEFLQRNMEIGAGPLLANLQCLALDFLQPVRDHFGGPIVLGSGMRYAECDDSGRWYGLDVAVQGHEQGSTSYRPKAQHTKGEAVDFDPPAGVDHEDVWHWIKDHCLLPFGQLIHEQRYHATRPTEEWLHVSLTGKRASGGPIYGEAMDYDNRRPRGQQYHLLESVTRW